MITNRWNINRLFLKIPEQVRQHRWKVWLLFFMLTVFFVAGVGRFQLEISMVSFFKEDEPVKIAYDRFRSIFGGDEIVYLVYEAKNGDVFSPEALEAVNGIRQELLRYQLNQDADDHAILNHITDVIGIVNAPFLEAKNDTLISRDFIGYTIPQENSELEKLKNLASAQVDYPRRYFSEDFRYGGIIIKTDFNAVPVDSVSASDDNTLDAMDASVIGLDLDESAFNEQLPDIYSEDYLPKFKKTRMNEYVPFMAAVHRIIDQPKYSEHLIFYPVGNPPLMAFAFKNMMSEMGFIMLGSLLLIILVLYVLFRSFSAVIWPVLIIIVSLVWVMGVIGWSGLAMTEMYNIVVFLVLAVGVADAIHILSGYLFYRNMSLDHQHALDQVYQKSGLACFLTSITTSLGLLSMVFIPIVPLQRFAVFAAVGVMIAFFLTIIMLPLLLDIWGPVSRKKEKHIKLGAQKDHFVQRLMQRYETFSLNYPKGVTLAFLVITVVLILGSLQVRVESNAIENLKDGIWLKEAYQLVDLKMGGTGNLEVLIDSGMNNGFKNPELLSAVDRLQQFIEATFPGVVVKTFSLANVTKDSFKALHNDDKTKYIIPQDSQTLAQTLFLFESANPKDRRLLVSDDYRMVRIGINSVNLGSIKGLEVMNAVDGYIDSQLKPLKKTFPNLVVTTTGQLPLQLKLMDYISWSQVRSFAIALITISIILLLVLGSVKIGFIAIIPNLLPIITAFGVMGYFDMALDVHTLLVVPIIIGIAVDDTIHFLTHFRLDYLKNGDVIQAIIHAYREAGQAIIFTSLVLAIGFLVFLFSSNKGFSYFGLLSAVSIFAATIADLVLLPALLYLAYRKKPAKTATTSI